MKQEKGKAAVDPEIEETTAGPEVPEGREARLEKLARNHILAAMGVGLLPLPGIDMVALTGIQLDMIKKLGDEYNIPFRKDRAKSIITSLVGGVLTVELGIIFSSLTKCIPVVGHCAGAVLMPTMSGGLTYAFYKVFVQHFESGGTFLDLDPAKVKSYFSEQFIKGKKVATDLKAESE